MNFLEELDHLRLKTPRLYNINIGSENSDYCTHSDKNKDCYLLFAANFCEDCMYGGLVMGSRDCVDCEYCDTSELCCECTDVDHCYNCNFSQDIVDCSDCSFCYDCVGCKNCFSCAGLRRQEYCYKNQKLPKEEYLKKIAQLNLKNEENRLFAQKELDEINEKTPHRATRIIGSQDCNGSYIVNSKKCWDSFDIHECEDSCYLKDCFRTKDSADLIFSDGSELCYESFSIGLGSYNCNFCNFVRTCSDCEYCELCFNCKNCFGCVGLQSKQFYILNKPYSRDEYFNKIAEIKMEMRRHGIYAKHLSTTYKFEDTAAFEN